MKVSRGMVYLFMERVPLRTHQVIRKELTKGRRTLYISKNAPGILRSQLDYDPDVLTTRWLTPRTREHCIPPMNLRMFERNINDFISDNEEGIVVLNGLDVLEKWNGFHPVLEVLRRTEDLVISSGGNLMISLDPKSHYELSLRKLESISHMTIHSCS